MSDTLSRKYGEAATINFELADDANPEDLSTAASFAAGDVVIMKDEGAEANTTNLPTDEGTGYSLVLTATEMQAARIMIYLIDQTATKVWMDKAVRIETYGNASAQHAFDLDTATADANVVNWNGSAVATPTTAGVPEVDITHVGGSAYSLTTAQFGSNVVNWSGTAVGTPDTAGYPVVTVKTGTGAGELDITSGTVDADMVAIGGNAQAATNQSAAARSMQILTVNTGNVASTTTTAQFTGVTETTADHFIGRKLFFYDSGDALFLQGTSITDSSWDAGNSEIVLTFQQLTEAPSDNDVAILV